jgi:hypothetical protein
VCSVLLALAGLAASAGVARADLEAQSAPGLRLSARFGYDGYYKEGQWIPVRVTVENDGPDARGQLRISTARGFSGGELVFSREVELPTQSRRELFLYVAAESIPSTLKVSLVDGASTLASASSRVVQLSSGDVLYGVLAGSPSAFSGLADVRPLSGSAFVAVLELADLPPRSAAWRALDVLVVSDVDTGALALEQRNALTDWIQSGGRLMVAGGPAWQKTTAGLSALLPVNPTQARTLTNLEALSIFASALPLEGEAVAATGALAPDAVELAGVDGAALIATRRLGFGQVAFLAVDPAFEPLRGWDGVIGMFRNVLSTGIDRPTWSYGVINTSSAQDAVNALPNLELPSPFLICGFLGVYLAVIGPLNYVVLRAVKRRELAWLTIPAVVAVFSLGAYLVGYQLSGNDAIMHQLALVQAWPESDQAHVDQIVGVFSPRRTTYDVQFAEGFLARPLAGYGASSNSLRVEQGEAARVLGVRTEIASIESFLVEGRVPAPRFAAELRLEVSGGAARLVGSVTNQSELTMQDAVLLAPGGSLPLNEFAPGESRQVSMLLAGSRAVVLPQNTIVPAGGALGSPPLYYPSSYDATIDEILGSSSYSPDREAYRRRSVLGAFINTYGGIGRGSGVYVIGWAAAAPVNATVLNAEFTSNNITAYVIALRTALDFGAGVITVPPGLMSWTPIEVGSKNGTASPYDATLYQGETYSVRFMPLRTLSFSRVTQLEMHLNGTTYSTTSVTPRVELWDVQHGAWVEVDVRAYGDHLVAEPERYVAPGGIIQVRLHNPWVDTITLNALDFTLLVER